LLPCNQIFSKNAILIQIMSLSSISIQRPVLTFVLSIVIILFGIIGFQRLGVREYPSIDAPVVNVSVAYIGANAEIIESQITEPLEESINGIAGVKSITSTSRDGRCNIRVEFELNIDIDAAASDVRDRVSRTVNLLPADAEPPVVAKQDADAGFIIAVNLKSETRGLLELNELGVMLLKEKIQTIAGVSTVQILGERRYAMRMYIDAAKLASYQLTALDVRNALVKENVELPSGRIEGKNTELSIKTMGKMTTVEEFNNLIIKQEGDRVVKFKDIGEVMLGAENDRTMFRRDGIPMIAYGIVPQPGSNQVAIAEEFYKRLEKVKKDLPADVSVAVSFDNTEYVTTAIEEVKETIYISFGLVVVVIFLFLRDWRTTLIPVLAIPISLIGTFFVMYLAGFTINVLTMLGIVLAIGLVVDDAIVVLENIYAKVEEGMNPLQAAFKGADEIFFAVISTTIVLAAVFLPIAFLQGLTGKLFIEFGVVIAASVLISAFVALTLTPMLSARLLRGGHGQHSWLYEKTEFIFVAFTNLYEKSLIAFMKIKWIAMPLILVAGFLIYYFGKNLPQELAPLEDRGAFRVQVTGYEGATYDFMDKYMLELTALVQKEVQSTDLRGVIAITSPVFQGSTNAGFSRIILNKKPQRQNSQQDIAESLGKKLAQLTDARGFVIQEPTINAGGGRGGGLPLQYVIQTSTLEKLKEALPKFLAEASQNPTFSVVDVNLKFTKPELKITIDRERASQLGISVTDIAQTLQLGLSGQRFGYFVMNGKQYQVLGQLKQNGRDNPQDVKTLYVRNKNNQLIQLDNVIKTEEVSSPPQLLRYNRYVAATISAGLAKGKTLGQGIEEMDKIADKVLGLGFTTALDGQAREFKESSQSLLFAFGFALVLIYLVLAAQFESIRDPFIIMLTVPLALAGALASLWLTNQSLNIFGQIGIIMLIGLVTKNAILIVEFANQQKEIGKNRTEAVIYAAVSRLRPILMTTACTILGILPIALALGAGAESRVSMGIAVIGGMVLSTFLTLYIIPAIYDYVSENKK
jgi:multidrug efflux pump